MRGRYIHGAPSGVRRLSDAAIPPIRHQTTVAAVAAAAVAVVVVAAIVAAMAMAVMAAVIVVAQMRWVLSAASARRRARSMTGAGGAVGPVGGGTRGGFQGRGAGEGRVSAAAAEPAKRSLSVARGAEFTALRHADALLQSWWPE